MLLLTDDTAEGARVQRSFAAAQVCAVLGLDEALRSAPRHAAIACLASLDPATSGKLRAALTRHRTDPRIPVLFLMRDQSFYASTQATSLGATELLPADASDEQLQAAARRMIEAGAAVAQARSPVADEVGAVGATLVAIFEAAQTGAPIAPGLIERGAEQLLASIRKVEIRPWLDVVRRHDDHTYQHCLLVAGIVVAFSARLGIAAAGQSMLAQAALVHDIGKASIPRHLLNKAGQLTAAETAVVRTHPNAGHALLARQAGLDPRLLAVVRHHHEYLDGSGYPDRLKARQIPDFVRLVTICDIQAALIERRAYKPAVPPKLAYDTLVKMGPKLDQSLVKAFAKLVEDM